MTARDVTTSDQPEPTQRVGFVPSLAAYLKESSRMHLTHEEQKMLAGERGLAVAKCMEIVVSLGEIFGAERLVPVASVQVAGVSYLNLGDAGLEFLQDLAKDGRVCVRTTLNPAGMDLERWQELGGDPAFAAKQGQVLDAYAQMGISLTLTCAPYLSGNVPTAGQHVAWSESSAVTYANSVLGAYTNREGGPSALAASLTGRTACFGLHLDDNRQAQRKVVVGDQPRGALGFGALGFAIGRAIGNRIPYITGVDHADGQELKSLAASLATFGGTALFHIEGVTTNRTSIPKESVEISGADMQAAIAELSDGTDPDFVSLGCPHCSLEELREISTLLESKHVNVETWITLSRHVRQQAEQLGYVQAIERSGARIVCDTCLAVAPLRGKFRCLATNSAKGCYYARGNNGLATLLGSTEDCVQAAVSGKWRVRW